jgi:putative transposase
VSDANVVKLLQPGSFADPLTEVLRNGARALLAQAIEAEVAEFLAKHVDLKTATGLRRVVRHGHLPERGMMTGIGPVVNAGEKMHRRAGVKMPYEGIPSVPRQTRLSSSLQRLRSRSDLAG